MNTPEEQDAADRDETEYPRRHQSKAQTVVSIYRPPTFLIRLDRTQELCGGAIMTRKSLVAGSGMTVAAPINAN